MAQEFYNFDEALTQLNLREEELRRLVSEGEIRAFREGDTMKLRRTDVENLRNELMGGEVVDLGGAGEELVFEDELELEETGMATEEISDMDTLLEEDVEDVAAAPAPRRAAPARRAAAAAPAADEAEEESMAMRAVMMANTVVLVLGIPIAMSIGNGTASGLAKSIAGIFADFSD